MNCLERRRQSRPVDVSNCRVAAFKSFAESAVDGSALSDDLVRLLKNFTFTVLAANRTSPRWLKSHHPKPPPAGAIAPRCGKVGRRMRFWEPKIANTEFCHSL